MLAVALVILGIRSPVPLASRSAPRRETRYGAIAPTVRIRRASGGELLPTQIFMPISLLCAQNLFGPPADECAERQLRDAMHQNLVERFSGLNSRPNALLVAETGSRIIGSCGIEISRLNENGRGDPTGDVRQRALLSNLVVARGFQGQGVGTKLLRECARSPAPPPRLWERARPLTATLPPHSHRSEALVRRWGLNELLLKVRCARPELRHGGRREPVAHAVSSPPLVPAAGGEWQPGRRAAVFEARLRADLRRHEGGEARAGHEECEVGPDDEYLLEKGAG